MKLYGQKEISVNMCRMDPGAKRLKSGVDHRNWTEYKDAQKPGEQSLQEEESILLLTGVFPFDVGQVGRAGVADGQTLLGHALVSVHVHQISRNRDLEASGTNV